MKANRKAPTANAPRAGEAKAAKVGRQARHRERAAQERVVSAGEDANARFVAAEVATGKWSKTHPAAVDLKARIGWGFEALQSEVLEIRKRCGIPKGAQPELAELTAMRALSNDEYIRGLKAALEGEQKALNAAIGAAGKVDRLNGAATSVRSRALAAQLLDVQVELSVFPVRWEKRPQLAASEEVARKVRAQHIGVWLAEFGVTREAAAKYLLERGYEKRDEDDLDDPYERGCAPDKLRRREELARALQNQAKREKNVRRLKSSSPER